MWIGFVEGGMGGGRERDTRGRRMQNEVHGPRRAECIVRYLALDETGVISDNEDRPCPAIVLHRQT